MEELKEEIASTQIAVICPDNEVSLPKTLDEDNTPNHKKKLNFACVNFNTNIFVENYTYNESLTVTIPVY